MKRVVLLAFGLFLGAHAALSAQAPLNFNELVERRGVYLLRGTLEPYTGPVIAMWDSVLVRERGTLLNRRWDGLHETFYFEGQLEVREMFRSGVLHGPFESWFREGAPSDKGTYRDGLLEGPYESHWSRAMTTSPHAHHMPSMDGPMGELAERGNFTAGQPCGEWYRWVPQDGGGLRAEDPITYPPCP
jgi:hypothetical protein